MTTVLFDLEADGLLDEATVVWCIATQDMDSRKTRFFGPDEIKEGLEYLSSADVIVAHNAFGYDAPLLKKLHGFTHDSIEDTLILSRLYRPDRIGGHSIEAYGVQFGYPKPIHEDWSQFSPEMRDRCEADVQILARTVSQLLRESSGHDWHDSIKLSYDAARLQTRIEAYGVKLDVYRAERTAFGLEAEAATQQAKLDVVLPLLAKPYSATDKSEGGGVKKPFLATGGLSKAASSWLDGQDIDVVGPFSRVVWNLVRTSSDKEMKDWLLSIGWEPDDWNYKKDPKGFGFLKDSQGAYLKSSPKITETSLLALENPAGVTYRELSQAEHRLTHLKHTTKQGKATGWLNTVRPDGRLSATAMTLGAATGRYTHKGIVNVPSVGAKWGEHLRKCLVCDEGMVMAGTDASGIQSRIGAHLATEFDGGLYRDQVFSGEDIHLANRLAYEAILGRMLYADDPKKSRGMAKNVGYGVSFGAGVGKVASMLNCSQREAKLIIDAYWDNSHGLSEVRQNCMESARRKGYIIGLDGRKIVCRSPHSALNTLMQNAEAVIMQHFFVMLQQWLDGVGGHILMHFHDEAESQMPDNPETKSAYLAEVERIGVHLTSRFRYTVPIEFDTDFGYNWAEVH